MNRIFVIICFSHRSFLKIFTGKKSLMNVVNMGRPLAGEQAYCPSHLTLWRDHLLTMKAIIHRQ